MASDFFRLDRGLVIDELAQVTTRNGTPSTADEAAAKVGSIFLQTNAATNQLNVWYKFKNDTGTIADWVQLASKSYVDTLSSPPADLSLLLYSENTSSPTPATATGTNAVALGFGATAGANKSLAIGEQSLTRIPGSVVIADGRFGTQGDAQTGKYLLRGVTATNVPVELLVGGAGGSRLVLPDNSTWTFRATITAHETSGTGRAGFEVLGVIYRNNGASTVALQGITNITTIGRSDTSWSVSATPDVTNGALKITVTGQNSKTIRWLASVETVELTN